MAADNELLSRYAGKVLTWILLVRDISDSVEIRGQRAVVMGIVIDAATGLIVTSTVGTAEPDVVKRALKDALARPAAPNPKAVPGRIICPSSLVTIVAAAATSLSKLVETELVEGVRMWDAEEIFDAAVGHLEGRAQPDIPPDPADWSAVYDELADYAAAAPWERWCDEQYFAVRATVGDVSIEQFAIIIGNAGIQRGFNLLVDPEGLAKAAESGGNPLAHLEGSLIVHLNPQREWHGVAVEKAHRYDWPSELRLIPQLLTVRHGEPADLGQVEARILALALRGVVEQDGVRLAAVGAPPVTGDLRFADDVVGTYEVGRPG